MLKKLLIASAILATTSSFAYAASEGGYAGAGIGLDNVPFKLKSDGNKNFDFGSRGALVNVFGGYRKLVAPNVSLGGEAFVNESSNQTRALSAISPETSATLNTKYSYGLSIVPGYYVTNDTMIFARAGIVRTRFDYKQTDLTTSTSQSSNKTINGAQVGLGTEVGLTKNLAVRAEYDWTKYRTFSVLGTKLNPTRDQVTASLVYNFG